MRITLWLSAFLFLPLSLYGQQGFRVAALNTENLFDCCHDSLDNSDDYLFLPSSTRRWSWRRYHAKLHNISKLIISIGADHPADLVALTEVENDSVLTHLTQRAILRRHDTQCRPPWNRCRPTLSVRHVPTYKQPVFTRVFQSVTSCRNP